MKLSEEQIIQYAKSKGATDEEIRAARMKRMSNGLVGGNPNPTGGERVQGALQGGIRGLLTGMGMSPDSVLGTNTASRNVFQDEMARQQAREMFEDPTEKAIKADYMQARAEQARRAPFYMTEQGHDYHAAGIDQRKAQARQAGAESDMMETTLPAVKQAIAGVQGGNVPPGTSISVGPVNMPVNPKLTGEEMAAVSAQETFTPISEDIKGMVGGGIYDSKLGNIGRTARQIAAGQENALFTSHDPKLQAVQGKINSLRRYVFGEGGKQLTPFEAKVVMALITPTGKRDEQIVTDLDEAVKIINSKARLALGGANAAGQGPFNDFSTMSDEELQRIVGGA
jgi:bacteriocin-like protein